MCAWTFGESWDCYATTSDAIAGYWDSGTATSATLAAGRFAGSQALQANAGPIAYLVKSSGSNDGVHHISCAFNQTTAITGTTLRLYLQLLDGATGQCAIVFRTDGAILLTSATPGGTVLATYANAFTAASTWYQFEFEVVINNTTGRFRVRRNGNPVDDFDSGAVLNTRGGTANNYANRLQVGANTSGSTVHNIDDLLWRSDAASVPWVGDIKCITRMPASDVAVQFSRTPTGVVMQSVAGSGANNAIIVGGAFLQPYTCSYNGAITSIMIATYGAATGNIKGAVWADNSGAPGAVLASCPSQAMVSGNNVFTLSVPLNVTFGQKIWIGACADTGGGSWNTNSAIMNGASGTVGFSTFPQASPSVGLGNRQLGSNFVYTAASGNWQAVAEPQQDAATSYVYDATPGNQDLYTIASIPSTPASTIAVTTRALMAKSDAGTRTAAVQLKSGATTVASPTLTLTTGWQWAWRCDVTNPATGAAWTSTAVNSLQCGPKTIA